MDSVLGSLIVQYKADIANLTANSAVARTEMSGVAEASSRMGGMVANGAFQAGEAIIGFAESSIPVAAKFQQSMLKVEAYAGLSKQATQDMGNSILDMAAKVGTKPTEFADAIYPIVSSGYDAAQSLNILQLSAETAAASGAKTSVVADMLTTSLKATHAPAQDAGKYMDIFNKMVSEGKGEVPQYAATLGKLSLAAGSAHVPFADMAGQLAFLTTHGFPSVAQAVNAQGNLYTQLGVKTDAVAQHAKKLGLAFDKNAFSSMDFGDKMSYLSKITGGNQGELLKLVGGSTLALKAFDAFSGGAKDLAADLHGTQNATGTTASAFATAASGWNATTKRMQASFEDLQIKVGTALLPVLTSLGNALVPVMNNFGRFITAIQNGTSFFQQDSTGLDLLKAAIAGIGIAVLLFAVTQIPVMIVALGGMAVAGWLAIAPLLPFILIGVAVAAVIFGIVEAVKHWGAISAWLVGAWGNVSGFFKNLWSGIVGVFGTIGGWFKDRFTDAKNAIGGAFSNLGTMLHDKGTDAKNGFQQGWGNVGGWFQDRGNDIKKTAQDIGQGAVNAGQWMYAHNTYWKAMVDTITLTITVWKNWLSEAWKWISDAASTAWHAVTTTISNAVTTVTNFVTNKWNQITGWISGQWRMWSTLAQTYFALVQFVIEAKIFQIVASIMAKWSAIHAWITDKWNALKGLAQGAWDGVVAVFDQIWNRISSPLNTASSNTRSWFENLASDAVQWGANIIQGVINGIESMLGAVGNAASNVAATVKNFLGFHSPAKMGPGAELNVWGPNLVKGFSQGIDQSAPILKASLLNLVRPMINYPIVPSAIGVASTVAPTLAAQNASTGEHTTIVQLDRIELTRMVQKTTDKLVTLKLGPRGRLG